MLALCKCYLHHWSRSHLTLLVVLLTSSFIFIRSIMSCFNSLLLSALFLLSLLFPCLWLHLNPAFSCGFDRHARRKGNQCCHKVLVVEGRCPSEQERCPSKASTFRQYQTQIVHLWTANIFKKTQAGNSTAVWIRALIKACVIFPEHLGLVHAHNKLWNDHHVHWSLGDCSSICLNQLLQKNAGSAFPSPPSTNYLPTAACSVPWPLACMSPNWRRMSKEDLGPSDKVSRSEVS